ncbi:host-nuclease inhibitor Gam family protein [Clostridium celatum]|uniref:host-nuclease inhibitor Gam family protein n=1 Tax=Clostridium celatum TaxID=36834 RepID=UPI0029136845|nr:host-nuclease inhibitor Gam family protein [Clostridium celatum]MDU6295580.1 host-nuclease inhibitor Gam family protein [Clostridium celatum]
MSNILLEKDLIESKEEFKVTNLQGATWCFRKLRAIEGKIEDITNVAAMEIERITEWLKNETKSLETDKAYFEGLLNAYYVEQRAKDNKFKLSTPYGKVTAKKIKKWTYDEEVVKEYVKAENLPFIRIKEELDKSAIKKAFKDGVNNETGEYIPGITIEEIESISIKIEGGI